MIRHAMLRTTLSRYLNVHVALLVALRRHQVPVPDDVRAALATVERWVAALEHRERAETGPA